MWKWEIGMIVLYDSNGDADQYYSKDGDDYFYSNDDADKLYIKDDADYCYSTDDAIRQ